MSYYYDRDYGDWYGSSRRGGKSKKGKSSRNNYSQNSWSWGSYWDDLEDTDEEIDNSLFIKEPRGYKTPKRDSVKYQITGSYNSYKVIDDSHIKFVKNLARYFYHEMFRVKFPDMIDEKFSTQTVEQLTDAEDPDVADYSTYKNVVDNLDEMNVPGHSPLGKAVFVYKKMFQSSNSTPNFEQELNHDRIDELINEFDFDENAFNDPELNNLLDQNDFSKSKKFDVLDKISFVQSFGDKFDVAIEVDEHIVQNSKLKKVKKMTQFEQIIHSGLYQRLFPNFKLKLACKDLSVNVPVQIEQSKQKIIILCDFSGSMNASAKQEWVCAILIDRLKHVMKGRCEIFFSYFNTDISEFDFYHAFDKESAIGFWKQFSTRPNGGMTNLGNVINQVNNEIKKGKLKNLDIDLRGEKVEILALNDGQDTIHTDNFAYKTNAISLMQSNDELKGLCLKNDGKYVFVDKSGEVKEYE